MRDRAVSPMRALVIGLVALGFVGCSTLTGKSAGRNVDDATITATVKAKLAEEKAVSLTRIDVDTTEGVVFLNGIVDNETERLRAADVARHVVGVYRVTNNLKVRGAS